MGNYRVITGQNIYDVALHLYGSIEGIVDLLINNPGLSLETELRTGQELTYTDGFIINADVVAYNEMHGIVPSNGERHVYPKHFTCPQTAVFSLSAALVSVQCEVSGTGRWKSTGAMIVQRKPSFSAIYRTRYTIRSTAVCATSAKSDGLPMPRSAISTGAA